MTDLARSPSDSPPTVTPLRPLDERQAPALGQLRQNLQRECEAMLQHALDKGKEIPPEMAQRAARVIAAAPVPGETQSFTDLTALHNECAALIAPASGRTLVLLEAERRAHPYLYMFGPVRLVRQMLAFAVLALVSCSLLSTLNAVDVGNVAKGWFQLDGGAAVYVVSFLLSVAALGAVFSNLATINRYIEQATYDPIFEGSYWVRIVLGLISGVVLGEILFDLLIRADSADAHALKPAGERVVLAFLGGFATAPVQRLLTNLSDAIGTLLQGRHATPPRERGPAPSQRKAQKPSSNDRK